MRFVSLRGSKLHALIARTLGRGGESPQTTDLKFARSRALAAYKDFLTLWKDADPDIPILKEAKASTRNCNRPSAKSRWQRYSYANESRGQVKMKMQERATTAN
jgi:hypothetical protein